MNKEDEIKVLLNDVTTAPVYDPEQSLENVLQQAKEHTIAKDSIAILVGWVWVLFSAFGVSMYRAKKSYDQRTVRHKRKRLSENARHDLTYDTKKPIQNIQKTQQNVTKDD